MPVVLLLCTLATLVSLTTATLATHTFSRPLLPTTPSNAIATIFMEPETHQKVMVPSSQAHAGHKPNHQQTGAVFDLPANVSQIVWTKQLQCSSDGCEPMSTTIENSRALQIIYATATQYVCQNSAQYTATITPPPMVPSNVHWASEMTFAKTAGKAYCKDYPGTISRCMDRYTTSFSVEKNYTETKTKTNIAHIDLRGVGHVDYPVTRTTPTVMLYPATVPGPHWGKSSPTALGNARSCSDEASCIEHCERLHDKTVKALEALGSILGILTLICLIGTAIRHYNEPGGAIKIERINKPRGVAGDS